MAGRLRSRNSRSGADYWPGFVDAFATLLMVITFLLSVFILGQFFLSEALSGRDRALDELNGQIAELTNLLALEKQNATDLQSQLSLLSQSLLESRTGKGEAEERARNAEAEIERLTALLDEREGSLSRLQDRSSALEEKLANALNSASDAATAKNTMQAELDREKRLSDKAKQQIAILNQQIAALRQQIAILNDALEASEARDKKQQAVIADLGARLNKALASKVQELSRYRSEFFGKLREILGERDDIRIVGDRFVFQSEVLFASGSATIQPAGREQLSRVADALIQISVEIPNNINWVLRVDGHTDDLPINTSQFPSNWELSSARAISVVQFLRTQGVPPRRLAATGFAEFQPLDPGQDEIARRRNRRIELKLTER